MCSNPCQDAHMEVLGVSEWPRHPCRLHSSAQCFLLPVTSWHRSSFGQRTASWSASSQQHYQAHMAFLLLKMVLRDYGSSFPGRQPQALLAALPGGLGASVKLQLQLQPGPSTTHNPRHCTQRSSAATLEEKFWLFFFLFSFHFYFVTEPRNSPTTPRA